MSQRVNSNASTPASPSSPPLAQSTAPQLEVETTFDPIISNSIGNTLWSDWKEEKWRESGRPIIEKWPEELRRYAPSKLSLLIFDIWHLILLIFYIWHLTLLIFDIWHLTLLIFHIWHFTLMILWHLTFYLIDLCHKFALSPDVNFGNWIHVYVLTWFLALLKMWWVDDLDEWLWRGGSKHVET